MLAARAEFNLISLEGPPGAGKTALALELANRINPESAVWLKAEPGWRPESLLYALRIPPEGPLEERLAMAARHLSHTVVLDDFHRMVDGDRLLQSWSRYLRGATVILTSRERLWEAGLDVYRMRLDALPEAESLLCKLLEQHGLTDWLEHRERLLEMAGGFPLQIKLLVGLIRDGRLDLRRKPRGLFKELALSPEERHTMAFLAICGRPVELPPSPWLESLERRFLVERSPDGSYSAHEVLRDHFLPERDQELHSRAAELEVARYEAHADLEAARHALRHLEAAGKTTEAADLLEQCRAELFQSAQYEFLLEWIDRVGQNPRLQIARADALAYLGRTRESLQLLELVERTGDPEERMQALNSRCHLVLEQGHLAEAARLAEQSLELQRRASGRRPGRVKALNGLALAEARMGRVEAAERHAREALEHAERIGDARGQAYAHYALALAARAQDRWEESLASALTCSEGAERRLTFLSRFLAGDALRNLGRDPGPILRQSLEEAEGYPDPLSRSMAELGRDPGRALELVERHGGRVFLAQVLLVQGDYRRGLKLAEEAGAVPLACEHAIRLELTSPEPSFHELERWRARAAERKLRGSELRARLARALCFGIPVGPVDFQPAALDQQVLDHLAGGPAPPAPWRKREVQPYRLVTRDGQLATPHGSLPGADLQLDLVRRTLTAFGKPVAILRKKTLISVLRALMLAFPEPRNQKELYLQAWGQPYVEGDSDAAVRKAISQLRDLLEPDRRNPTVIRVRPPAYGQKNGYVLGVSFALLENFMTD